MDHHEQSFQTITKHVEDFVQLRSCEYTYCIANTAVPDIHMIHFPNKDTLISKHPTDVSCMAPLNVTSSAHRHYLTVAAANYLWRDWNNQL